MNRSYIKLYRGTLGHEIFADEPYTEREAWIWLLENANFQPNRIRYKSKMISVDRGQVPASYRKLAEKWCWGKDRVRNFLSLLENEGMILREVGTGFLVITICNYTKFQSSLTIAGTQPGTDAGTVTGTQSGTNKRNKEGKESKKSNLSPPYSPPPYEKNHVESDQRENVIVIDPRKKPPDKIEEQFQAFWEAYGKIGNRKPALTSFIKTINSGVDYAKIITGLKRYQAYCRHIGREQQHIKHASTWLNQRGWEDEYPVYASASKSGVNAGADRAIQLIREGRL